jgi:hypothetical protein
MSLNILVQHSIIILTDYSMNNTSMTEQTTWRDIFGDLIDDSGCYEIGKVNLYKLAAHLEELYVRIADLEGQLRKNGTL